jgi:hypothetical protein
MMEQERRSDLVSLAQAAKAAGVHPSSLLRRIKAGRLQHVRVGRSFATTLQWVSESEEPGPMGRPPKRMPARLKEGTQEVGTSQK